MSIHTSLDAYQQARSNFQEAIIGATALALPAARIKGSFKYGDFHFNIARRETLSDLDLTLDCATERDRHHLAVSVSEQIYMSAGARIRVSVQAHNHHDGLNLPDSRLLAVGEYLRHAPSIPAGHPAHAYLLAKACLGVLRSRPSQRPRDIAMLLGSSLALTALGVKLGTLDSFSAVSAQALLDQGIASPESAILTEVIQRAPSESDAQQFIAELGRRPDVHPWLTTLFERLVLDPWK